MSVVIYRMGSLLFESTFGDAAIIISEVFADLADNCGSKSSKANSRCFAVVLNVIENKYGVGLHGELRSRQ